MCQHMPRRGFAPGSLATSFPLRWTQAEGEAQAEGEVPFSQSVTCDLPADTCEDNGNIREYGNIFLQRKDIMESQNPFAAWIGAFYRELLQRKDCGRRYHPFSAELR